VIGNLLMTARTPSGTAVALVGMRGRVAGRPAGAASHPLVIASVGPPRSPCRSIPLSHALLFSLTGASMAGALFAAVLAWCSPSHGAHRHAEWLRGWRECVTGADRRAAFRVSLVRRCHRMFCAWRGWPAGGSVAKYVSPALD